MKIVPILHQQIVQLRWHVLACLGLIMVLPLEEAVVNWREGAGFYAAGMAVASVFLAPLLAGLIACANVQADLDDRRYTFWRSKPVGAASFITIKFAIGLLLALFIFAFPVVFGLVGDKMYPRTFDRVDAAAPIYWNFLLITVMAYSVCFLCNVLMRKTARAWLIGIAVSCFVLVIPFILPLQFKDINSDFLNRISAIYLYMMFGASLAAFCCSLAAIAYDWHFQANIKGLLWAVAGMVFLLILVCSRQIANITVLDEIQAPETFDGRIGKTDNQLFGLCFGTISIENDNIKLNPVDAASRRELIIQRGEKLKSLLPEQSGLRCDSHMGLYPVYITRGNKLFMFSIWSYYKAQPGEQQTFVRQYVKLYACVSEIDNGFNIPVSILDISDSLIDNSFPAVTVREIENKLIMVAGKSYAVVEIDNDGRLNVLDKQHNAFNRYYSYSSGANITISLIPIDMLYIKNRIKFSIDVCKSTYTGYKMEYSCVDIVGDKISFCRFSNEGIRRYEVERWDDKSVYCTVRDSRPFTLLEQMFGGVYEWNNSFVKDGKLYIYGRQKLMVFDIRSEHIRKLGHWERVREEFSINDVEILDNGNILLTASERQRFDNGKQWRWKRYLYLLKNPE